MIGVMILTEILNISRLALPLVLLYGLFPRFFNLWSILLCALMLGAYVSYVTYKTTKNSADRLQHIPSDQYLQLFHHEITQCGLEPSDVCLRYAYTDDAIAMAMLNTIALDPMLWKGITDDPQFINAKNIIERHIIPSVTENKKTFHSKLNNTLSPNAQKFIFRHELGHIFHRYSTKYILVIGVIGVIMALAGMLSAYATITTLGSIEAVLLSIFVASTTDIALTYTSNLFFKAHEEKKADMFAMQYSTKEEINAAADFFEQHELCAQEYRKSTGELINTLPSTILTGHPDGATRASYLRKSISA